MARFRSALFAVLAVSSFGVACSSNAPVQGTCTAPKSACGANCADLRVDDQNCGSCGRACPAGEACANGACYPNDCPVEDCDPASVCFEMRCRDKSCVGQLCPEGMQCSQGACVCGGTHRTCDGACADLQLDDANCGACGTRCPGGQSCAGGACLADDCGGVDCDPLSVCFAGSCRARECVGVACPPGLTCRGGVCTCAEGQRICDGRCVTTATDSAHCGACGVACAAGTRCAGGQCFVADCGAQTCDPLSACQNGQCVERVCIGITCAQGQSCAGGVCQCPAGLHACAGECADVMTDRGHCGSCPVQCGTGESCIAGTCVPNPCPAGQSQCAGACTDTSTNPSHCGGCGITCGGGRICTGSQCVCPPGLTFCGGNCVNLSTDGQHCGMCGRGCSGGTCAGGNCSCGSGTMLCNGTCIDPYTDRLNCGGCLRGCATGQSCSGGSCGCSAGFSLCGGQCVPTSQDSSNCGSCGNVCPINKYCNASTCQDMFTCQANFVTAPAACPLFPLDESQCGVPALASRTPWIGQGLMNGQSTSTPILISPSERITISGSLSGAGSGGGASDVISIKLASGLDLTQQGFNAPELGMGAVSLTAFGSPYACRHPTEAEQLITFRGNVAYNLSLDRYTHNGKWNTGAATAAAAPQLASVGDGGIVCDQVCGYLSNSCGDTRYYWKLTVPPKKAVVIELGVTPSPSGSQFRLDAHTGNGGFVCTMVNAGLSSPSIYRGRLVNNTDTPQLMTLVTYVNFRDAFVNLVTAVEP